MQLYTREWGAGDRVAVLIHGIMADSQCWWRVGPALAERGYRVIAVDLPGHGRSPRAEDYPVELFASSVLESVPAGPELAIGHSLGGLTLAAAVERLKPARAIYSDPAFRLAAPPPGIDMGDMLARAANLSADEIAAMHPGFSADEVQVEVEMLKGWDVRTAHSVAALAGSDFTPPLAVPSLVQAAGDGFLIPAEFAEELRGRGFEVRVVAGAEHTIHRHVFEAFMEGLDGWI
ncbi:alpha/beta fold hydrolase [Nonomuraea sp. NBC_01738]|uniref:alpha/beta fold hydrolase n=1 Tax=Nonomuraea sp. NBC_01738 TaxID=2976003 RepID=UPI002E0E4EAE|nr:alpha/beta fold hydrolase [Nonomuraea sp. NBC_01738]